MPNNNDFRPGDLFHIVRIERPSTTLDALGHSTGYETFVDNVPANVEDASGREAYQAGQRFADSVSHVVRMPYIAGVESKMRVVWADPILHADRFMEIQYVLQPDKKRIEHRLYCLESVTNA
jgi:head-tail adaptor